LKTILKILLALLLFLVILIASIFFILNSETMLNKTASLAISKSGLDVKYRDIKGNLFDGLDIKEFNYEDKVKGDLKLKVDFLALKEGTLYVNEVNLSNLWIDKEFLETLGQDSNESKQKSSEGELFIKRVIVDSAYLNVVDLHYQEYVVDSLTLDVDNLSYDMKKDINASISASIDSNVIVALLKADIKDEKYTMHLDGNPKKEFLSTFVKEHNVTVKKSPKILVDANGDYQSLKAIVRVEDAKLRYQDIDANLDDLNLTAIFDIEKGDLDATLFSFVDSSVLDLEVSNRTLLNIDDLNNTLFFDLNSTINPKKPYLTKYTAEQNITIKKLPELNLKASGDLKNIASKLIVDDGNFSYNDIVVNLKGLNLDSNYSLKDGNLDAKIISKIDSNLANFNLDGTLFLNSNDINNSLKVDLSSYVIPSENYLKVKLDEQNITIKKMPQFILTLNGDFKNLDLLANLSEGKFSYNDIMIEPKLFDINSSYSIQKGLLNAKILADIDSNVASVNLNTTIKANTKDINNTLIYKGDIDIIAQKYNFKEFGVEVTKPTTVALKVAGDAKKLKALYGLDGELIYDNIKIKPRIYDSNANFNLKTKELDALLFADIDTTIAKINSDAKVSLNIDDINNTLKYDFKLFLKDSKSYQGVDLSSLGDIDISAIGSLKELDARIKSPKLSLLAKSVDFDKFDINLDTKKIYIGKIYKDVPRELRKSFINLKSDGYYKLSSKEAKFTNKVRGLKYDKNNIFTDDFDIYIDEDNIKISNLTIQAKDFKMYVDVDKDANGAKAIIKNRAINAFADVKFDPFYIDANVTVGSIDKLIKEINKIYPLQVGVEVDGELDLKANMEGEDAKITLISPKIKFADGSLYDLNILSFYNKDRVLIKNFDFELKDFEPKEVNRKVKLKRDALITFGKDANLIDIEFDNLLTYKAEKKGDVTTGKLSIKDLILAYKGYGYTKLNSSIDIFQSTDKLAVTGFVEFADSEINYESQFLDVSKDPDIIIVTKKDKEKKTKPVDSFLENTFLDLDIRSKNEMLYKVDAGAIEFKVDINVRKDLGNLPKITGRVNVIDGEYDFADKRFMIKEGAIAFRGQEGSNPLLDLHVNYEEIEDVIIKIAIGGDKNRPKLTFSSEPMMSKKDIFSYMLFGMSASETDGAATSANKAAEKIFGRAIAKDLARELNLDRLDMNRNTLGGIDIKAGKKINRKSIIYYQNRSNESSILYEKKLSDKWSIETEVGKQGQGVELFYRRGYK